MVTTQLQQFIPKIRGAPLVVNIERILQPVTDFIRGNPIVSTAIVGAGTTGLVVASGIISRPRKSVKKKVSRKKAKKKIKKTVKKVTKRKKKTHRSPRHRGHKFVTFTTKDGKKVKFKVAKKPHAHKKRRRR